ncbi:MAG: HAD family hydrolase [Oscillospiraceae bacterium]|jgi:Cof subfamily protein (haloacid dehalogenase superfamily)|nr:HAD family hydrolase [Oscillospiraceae bacterium]
MILYLTDLDGTLLNYAAKLKPRTAEILNRQIKNGALFSYATARRFQTAGPIMQEVEMNIPVITMNGVIIVDPKTGERISTDYIAENSIEAAKRFIIENNETPLVYSHVDGVERVSFLNKSHKAIKAFNDTRKGDPFRHACNSYDELFKGEICYITFLNPESEISAIDAVLNRENGFCAVTYLDTYTKNLRFYEAWSVNVSKAVAALKLKELAGADKIIAFGDNLNDIPMFEIADESYAVENAVTELKAIATGIISSNENMGVPVFIERRTAKIWDYKLPPVNKEPDKTRFASALEKAEKSKITVIGTLNEKLTHAALKNYFSVNSDREVKIGSYYADAAGENGIYEIQTAGWDKLKVKLDVFLEASHVTVVYPFEQRVHNAYIDENTGELLKKSPIRNNKDMTRFFLELYRIKGFLTHPNLTICIAGLEIEKFFYVSDEKNLRKRNQKKHKKPLSLLSEVYLNSPEDYRMFLPDDLPEKFTRQEFIKLSKKCNDSIILEILEYMSVINKIGKKGREFIYSVSLQ